jgi:hypothetical protein
MKYSSLRYWIVSLEMFLYILSSSTNCYKYLITKECSKYVSIIVIYTEFQKSKLDLTKPLIYQWEDKMQTDFKEIGREGVNQIYLSRNSFQRWVLAKFGF